MKASQRVIFTHRLFSTPPLASKVREHAEDPCILAEKNRQRKKKPNGERKTKGGRETEGERERERERDAERERETDRERPRETEERGTVLYKKN